MITLLGQCRLAAFWSTIGILAAAMVGGTELCEYRGYIPRLWLDQ